MNVARMRLIDRWLGVPVCLLLSVWRKLFGRRTLGTGVRPRRLLFVKLAEQGSTVLAQSALQSAIDKVGADNVFFLLFAENRPILDVLDVIPPQNVVAIDARGLLRALWGSLMAIGKLRRLNIDAAIDLEFFARSSAALCYLSGAGLRVGYHAFGGEASYRGDLMTHRLSFNPYLHTSQAFQIMVQALYEPAHQFPLLNLKPAPALAAGGRFRPRDNEYREVQQTLDDLFAVGQAALPVPANNTDRQGCLSYELFRSARRPRLVLLNANASDLIPLRRWEGARYVELARRLLRHDPNVCIAFTGAANEAAPVAELVSQVDSPRCVSMAGKTTLRQLLVLCTLAEVLVSNDSGPAHFATLTDVDVVVLFGPETPRLFAATSPRTHALWAGLACSPCINAFNNRASSCTNNACMQAIAVADVFDAVCRCLAARPSAARPLTAAA